jgi:AhpD family alkylhydroperoxidase
MKPEMESAMSDSQARIPNPALSIPELLPALQAAAAAARKANLPMKTVYLVHLRASQINGCGFCVNMHAHELREIGETDDRLFGVAAWRETSFFTAPERAALALTEAATRLNDRSDPVPDEVWNEAARHYDVPGLAGLVVQIALVNLWNRLNVSTRRVVGEGTRWIDFQGRKA